MNIPQWPVAGSREQELIEAVLASKQWGGFNEMVGRVEREFAAYQGCRFGVAMANGTVTLEVGLKASGIGPGDEVIVPAISFISTATAVARVGAIPVFTDIEPYSFNLDPDRVEQAITRQTKAILAVHFGGPLADMTRLQEIATKHGLLLLEDAAHAHGSEWEGKRAGSLGQWSSFSFQNGKVLTCGEGGMVLTNDETIDAALRSHSNQGRRPGFTWFHHFDLASNARFTGLQAAVLLSQLAALDGQIERRTRNAALLLDALRDVDGITWQKIDPRVTRNSWYLVLGRIDEAKFGMSRDAFHKQLTAAGVPCTPFYPHTLYENPLWQATPCRVHPCPVSEACIRDAFWLPHYLLLGDEELIVQVAGVIEREVAA